MFINHLSVAERGDGMMEPHTRCLSLSHTHGFTVALTHTSSAVRLAWFSYFQLHASVLVYCNASDMQTKPMNFLFQLLVSESQRFLSFIST